MINQDQFLKNQDIEVQRSHFLKTTLEQKEKGIKQQYNALDVHGRRLSKYWQPGDTITTVSIKRMKSQFIAVFDPDTYTKENLRLIRQKLIKQKINILGMALTLLFPLSMYFHFVRPKLLLIKRTYLMQYYNKIGFFSKQFGLKTKQVSKNDIQKNI